MIEKIVCDNCQYENDPNYNYCNYCGQDNRVYNHNFKSIFLEILFAISHFDKKIIYTLKKIIFPHKILKDFFENKRARYYSPIKLFIFIGLVSVFFYDHTRKDIKDNINFNDIGIDTSHLYDISRRNNIYKLSSENGSRKSSIDSFFELHRHSKIGIIDKLYVNFNYNLYDSKNFVNKLYSTCNKFFYYSFLFLVPYFSFVLLLLIGYKKYKYYFCLIYGFLIHIFFFLGSILYKITSYIVLVDISFLYWGIFYLYFLYSIHKGFNISLTKTIIVGNILSLIYFTSIFIVFLFAILMYLFFV